MLRLVALALVLSPLPAAAQPALLCLGTDPRFLLTVTGGTAAFDYLGDGRFSFVPAPEPDGYFSRHDLIARRATYPVFIAPRRCRVSTLTLPYSVTIEVDTATGIRPFTGCCIWRREGAGAEAPPAGQSAPPPP